MVVVAAAAVAARVAAHGGVVGDHRFFLSMPVSLG